MKWKSYESKWRKAWKKDSVFEPKRGLSKKFFLTIPYPYTSGPLHIGHGRTFTLGDVIARFKRHQGFNVLLPMAFHISGSPILSISDRIIKEDSKTINMYKSYLRLYEKEEDLDKIIEKFKDPEKVARYFADKIRLDFESIGYSIDWTRQFNTGEPMYNKFIEWQYHQLKEKGALVKGKLPILWSLEESQPVGEDDIAEGDIDRVTIVEFTVIKFPFKGDFLVAATLRPETLFGATNIWINPEGIYVRAKVGDEHWIISREAAEKFRVQGRKVDVSKDFRGREIMSRFAENPLTGKRLPVLPASFVDLDNGTGIVYSVPAHAPYDYQGLMDLKTDSRFGGVVNSMDMPVIIDVPGFTMPAKEMTENFDIIDQKDPRLDAVTKEIYKSEFYSGLLNDKCGEFAGMRVEEAKNKMKLKLLEEKKSEILFETSRKAITRAKNKVVVGVIEDQWFLDYGSSTWKNQTRKWLGEMMIFPDKFRKLFLDTQDWIDKRPCARKRGLGTEFPFDPEWVIESLSDSTIYMALYTVAQELRKVKPEQLTLDVFDFLFLGKGDAKSVSKSSKIPESLLTEAREEFTYWYPNDQRHTAPAHISNHLTFFIMHHLAIFNKSNWPQGISLNDLLVREGVKMSKSKGNVIPLVDVAKKYGSDLYRLYVVSSADLDAVIDWRERDVHSVSNKLEKFVDIIEKSVDAKPAGEGLADRWFESRFTLALAKATEHMEHFRFRDAIVEMLFKLLKDFKWLERRSSSPYGTVNKLAKKWIISLAPVIPHTAEEFWHRLGGEGYASLAQWPTISTKVDNQALEEENFVISVVDQVRELSKIANKKPKKICLYTALPWKYDALKMVMSEQEKSMKKLDSFKDKEAASKFILRLVKQRVWERVGKVLDEVEVLKNAKSALEGELAAEIVINPKSDPMNKKEKAMPFGPAIYLI